DPLSKENRRNIREEAKEENSQNCNKKRKSAHQYKVGDFVTVQRTQFGTGPKLRPKFFDPYEVVKLKNRYDVKKVGQHERPNITS
ncbi:hypothetical protein AVEN_167215-1, partial [Araneus ventricosus]